MFYLVDSYDSPQGRKVKITSKMLSFSLRFYWLLKQNCSRMRYTQHFYRRTSKLFILNICCQRSRRCLRMNFILTEFFACIKFHLSATRRSFAIIFSRHSTKSKRKTFENESPKNTKNNIKERCRWLHHLGTQRWSS